MAITIKTKEEIALLREGGGRLAGILEKVVSAAKPGVSTQELDELAEELIFESGGAPSFKGYKGRRDPRPYPCSLCISVNDEIVHAIPRKGKILKEGDAAGLDIGMWWPANRKYKAGSRKRGRSLCTDMAVTIGIGKISAEAERLIRATREALDIGIRAVQPGARVGDIGYAVQKHLEAHNLGIIRNLAGHGLGYEVHEEPLIPNFGEAGAGPELKENMVIAIEPMATLGGWRVELDDDEWTFRTSDGSLSAHFEHTIAVTKDGAEVLTML
jgi:methionyl aminopeptidase